MFNKKIFVFLYSFLLLQFQFFSPVFADTCKDFYKALAQLDTDIYPSEKINDLGIYWDYKWDRDTKSKTIKRDKNNFPMARLSLFNSSELVPGTIFKTINNSFIVIKSDHGKPNGYYDEFPLKLRINESRYWGLGRYKTFLMIKNTDKINSEIEIITKHVFLHDLAKTYCSFFYKETICDKKYIGNNLDRITKEFKNYEYEIFIPNKKETFLKLEVKRIR